MKNSVQIQMQPELLQSYVSGCAVAHTAIFHQCEPILDPLVATRKARQSLGFVFQQIRIVGLCGGVATNETVLLAMADCQAKTDESTEIIILKSTAETRQPQAIEAI